MNPSKHQQSGAALVVSLILLVIMTILGVSAISRNVNQERMAGASMERNMTAQLADAARLDAEFWLNKRLTWPQPSSTAAQPDVWPRNAVETLIGQPLTHWTDTIWTSARFLNYGDQTGILPAALNTTHTPRYITVEWANPIDNEVEVEKKDKGISTFYYTTVAHGLGPADSARSTLLSTQPKIFK